MVEQLFNLATQQRVQIPELVNLHQVGVITGEDEIRIIFQEQIGDVVQVDEPIQNWGTKAMLLAEFVAEQSGGFGQVVDERRSLGCGR